MFAAKNAHDALDINMMKLKTWHSLQFLGGGGADAAVSRCRAARHGGAGIEVLALLIARKQIALQITDIIANRKINLKVKFF